MTERERLIELIINADIYDSNECKLCAKDDDACDCCHAEKIADYLLANGVKVPPCEVGDTVWIISRGHIIPMIVNCISFNGNYEYCLTCNYVDEERYGYSNLSFTDMVRGYMFGFTKEEAEKALKERNKEK